MIKIIIRLFELKLTLFIFLFLTLSLFTPANASNSSCNPKDIKPIAEETRLVNFSISPDIVAVGNLTTVSINVKTGLNKLEVSIPDNMEVIDYYPKTLEGIKIEQGKWYKDLREIPIGTYSVTLKPTYWTQGKWAPISYSATNFQGTGYAKNYYYVFYDTVGFEITLDDRNQAPQTTRDVVRKVTVKSEPDIQVNLTTNKGDLGPTISQKQGKSMSQKTLGDGSSTVFLFTKEGEKVTLTVSSSDTCQDSSTSRTFKIGRSDIARTYKNYDWLWWFIGLIIIIIVLSITIRAKRKKENV